MFNNMGLGEFIMVMQTMKYHVVIENDCINTCVSVLNVSNILLMRKTSYKIFVYEEIFIHMNKKKS